MQLSVNNEIGRLKSVLVHLPGREIDVMIPSMMEQLLFDDILYGQVAREEHRRFQQIIYFVADQVFDLQDLLEEVFDDGDVRTHVMQELRAVYGFKREVFEWLEEKSAAELAESLLGGITLKSDRVGNPVYALAPVPNAFFMRDPQVVIGDGVSISSMATEARSREPLLSRIVFKHHKAFAGRDLFWMDQFEQPWPKTRSGVNRRPTLEGGDVLVPRRDMLLVGLTERTNKPGIERLIESLKESNAGVKTVIVVELPKRRSFMHLDTVFTITSRNECLAYPPAILEAGPEQAKVFAVDLTKREITYSEQKGLLPALKKRGMDLEPIYCGGSRPIDQQREQWTDGANAFALAPGIILLYERNIRTAEELVRHGYTIVYEDDLLLGRTELETWSSKKYAIQLQGNELSRARGGPRCMTMPLEREDV